MIDIDGSWGEGGGQILRTSLALSALLQKPVRIFNIRKGRKVPGLKPQHFMGVKILGDFCNAEIKGLRIGSTEIEFVPKGFILTDKQIDIGTAGSISLLLQILTPLLIFSSKEITLTIKGGTSGLGAPNIEYLKYVTFPLISKLGIKKPEIEVIKQGYYPKGQGLVKVKFYGIRKINSINLTDRGKVLKVRGVSVVGSLPADVCKRQKEGAESFLKSSGIEDVEIETVVTRTASPGTSITLWAECKNSLLGADDRGEKGVRAEVIGRRCAEKLLNSIKSGAALDKFMADQILVFLALAESFSEITVEKITNHCLTNIWVIEKILGIKFEVSGKKDSLGKLKVKGIGFTHS